MHKVSDTYGIQAENPQLKPLKHVSPTQFSSLKECQLRAVLAAGYSPNLLPISPSSRLGIVVHRIIEMNAGHGLSERDFMELWEKCVRDQEYQMNKSWFERHLLPLSKTALDFHVKKSQCFLLLKHSESLSEELKPAVSQCFREKYLKSKDRLVIGRADEIRFGEDGASLIDYKTGNVLDQSVETEIQTEYQNQLKIYAALFNEEHGLWPKNLILITLDGKYHKIEFSRSECLTLLNQAKDLLLQVNKIIMTDVEPSLKLASPSPSRCRYCLYRPCCKSYFIVRRNSSPEGWPNDFWGTVTEKKLLLNGLGKLALKTFSGTYPISIRALKLERHIALKSYQRIGAFSLCSDNLPNYYREGQFTTIYGLDTAELDFGSN